MPLEPLSRSDNRTGVDEQFYTLVPIRDTDIPFLFRLYASSRTDEMELTNWPQEEKNTFLEMQFNFQHHHYTTFFPDAQLDKIQVDGTDVGRLYVYRTEKEILIIDIALLPEFQHRGIGLACMQHLLAEAEKKGLPVRLHVERFNHRALEFYKKTGFKIIQDQDVYLFLEWKPFQDTKKDD